jgi:hypothetical protein
VTFTNIVLFPKPVHKGFSCYWCLHTGGTQRSLRPHSTPGGCRSGCKAACRGQHGCSRQPGMYLRVLKTYMARLIKQLIHV